MWWSVRSCCNTSDFLASTRMRASRAVHLRVQVSHSFKLIITLFAPLGQPVQTSVSGCRIKQLAGAQPHAGSPLRSVPSSPPKSFTTATLRRAYTYLGSWPILSPTIAVISSDFSLLTPLHRPHHHERGRTSPCPIHPRAHGCSAARSGRSPANKPSTYLRSSRCQKNQGSAAIAQETSRTAFYLDQQSTHG